MGFDLTNDAGGSTRFSPSGWALALTLAEHYGWKPAGTKLERTDWSGEYATNEGQRVTASDAQNLAEACERALVDTDYLPCVSAIKQQIDAEVARLIPGDTPRAVRSEEILAFRERLKDLVAFCRGGGFIIE